MSRIADTFRRLLYEQWGYTGRVWIGLGMAIAIAGGGLIYQQGTQPAGDVTPPTVTLDAPANGATVSGTIAVSATAADETSLSFVEFLRNAVAFATDNSAPYSVNFDTTLVADGAHTFTARAQDATGNSTVSNAAAVTVNNGGPPLGTANLWIDTNGGTCTRQASPAAYVDAAACGSLGAAHSVASCGDLVLIKAGSYGGQTITNAKSCADTWTVGASHGVTCTSCVDAKVAPGETVTLSSTSFNNTDFLIVERGNGTDLNINGWGIRDGSTNIAVIDADISEAAGGVNFTVNSGYDNLAVVGGTWTIGNMAGSSAAIYIQTCDGGGCPGTNPVGTDVLIDGINFIDACGTAACTGTGDPHTEIVRVDQGWQRVIIRNNGFYQNNQLTTGSVFITALHQAGNSTPDPRDITITNNYFGSVSPASQAITLSGAITTCTNYLIAYNTIGAGTSATAIGCNTSSVTWVGNLGVKPEGSCYGTYIKNVWQNNSNVACGSDTWVNGPQYGTGNLGLGGADGFTLQAGSPAIAAGETTYCPSTDHNGSTRPAPGATNCDAGGNERNQ